MYKRKYDSYTVDVIDKDTGNTLNMTLLKYNQNIIDKTNYKQMLELYKKIKNRYKNKNVIINFCGISELNKFILYSKTIDTNLKIQDRNKEVEENKNNINNLYDLSNDLNNIINRINKRIDYCNNMRGATDKQVDVIEHQIENLVNKNVIDLTNSEKNERLQMLQKLKLALNERRNIKNEVLLAHSISDNYIKTLNKINTNMIKQTQKANMRNIKIHNVLQDNKIDVPSNLMIKKSYSNFKERIRIMQEVQQKCQKVVHDEQNHIIYGYTKVGNKKKIV